MVQPGDDDAGMTTLTDLEIARAARLAPIEEIAASAGIEADHLEPYGRHVAKVTAAARPPATEKAKYVVVTAVTPTPLGEGKTTTAIGLVQGLRNVVVGLGERVDGVPRQGGFDITAASEVMALLSLCTSLRDLRERLGRIVVGFTFAG